VRSLRRALSPVVLVAVTACSQTFDAASLGVPVTMAAPAGEAVQGKPFKVNTHSVHGLWGLVTISQANLRKGLAAQLVGGDQVAQLKIKSRSRWFDVVISGITLGLIVPRTVTYEGIVIGR
jgi:hypothetical protein